MLVLKHGPNLFHKSLLTDKSCKIPYILYCEDLVKLKICLDRHCRTHDIYIYI